MDKSTVVKFIADRWVSWVLELTVLSVIAFYTISETRKTAEQTREMLTRYDAAISQFAAEKSGAVDEAVSEAYSAAKDKAKSITLNDVKSLLKSDQSDAGSESGDHSN